ncbi:hypothetical protein [Streptomyces sp. NPDC044948]|uniref:hypothetical protein n=1 Tax=Streptomyces sp. NPDC044948 TaxID=3157092 RepID=UPI0033EB5B4D
MDEYTGADMIALSAELATALRLGDLCRDSDGASLVREYLVRRAAAGDRLAEAGTREPDNEPIVDNAEHFARELMDHDFLNGGTLGPLPVDAPCWSDNPRGYARQEHRAWVIEHEA